jgi:ferric-dicitrate binding protein FerR (iron transport regulator)
VQDQSKDDEPLSQAEGSAWAEYFRDVEEYDQIQRDLERTHQNVPFFNSDAEAAQLHHKVRRRRRRRPRGARRALHAAICARRAAVAGVAWQVWCDRTRDLAP